MQILDAAARAWLHVNGLRSRFAQVGDYRIHYYAGGEGRPLVLVHGLGGSAENWARMMPGLTSRRRVYALDLLGFGRSDRPDVDYSINLQTELLACFLASLGVNHVDLGGWSMGGWVALNFALNHPGIVRRIFVVNSAGMSFNLHFAATLFQPKTVEAGQELLNLLTPQARLIPRFVTRDLVREMQPSRPVVMRTMHSMMAGSELLDGKLGRLQAPVLIVWGKQDALIPLACGEEMHRQIPNSRLAIFDGCGHLLPAESTSRLLPEAIRFLDADPPLPAAVHEYPA